MGQTLIVTKLEWKSRDFTIAACLEGKKLLEVTAEPKGEKSILNHIYVGRVKDVVKNLNAAFIEIAPGVSCYYSLEECRNPIYVKKINSPRMVQGDEVVVQVVKENMKSKPPKVSTNLNFPGTYLVLTTENKSLGISRKLPPSVRETLKEAFASRKEKEFGIIVRTNAAQAELSHIMEEYEQLKGQYLRLKETAVHRTCFSCLREGEPEYLALLKGADMQGIDKIITDHEEIQKQIQEYLLHYYPKETDKLQLYQEEGLSLNSLYSLEIRIREALQEKVWLKSGGYLIIQPTEALTVIDVNTGKSIAKKQVQEHYLKINLEAAEEIAHQLRLRNLSGIIIIDFIDMKSGKDRTGLLQALEGFTQKDSVPVQVVDMTRLNLVELTRKKVRKSLAQQFERV